MMGRTTTQQVRDYSPNWPYEQAELALALGDNLMVPRPPQLDGVI